MTDVPIFRLYGSEDNEIQQRLQPTLGLREWSALTRDERMTILQDLKNRNLIGPNSPELLKAMQQLSFDFLRQGLAKQLHSIPFSTDVGTEFAMQKAAYSDFLELMLGTTNDAMAMRMLSYLLNANLRQADINEAKDEQDETKRNELIRLAFRNFDHLSRALNYLFGQFAINHRATRTGIVPISDPVIAQKIYVPTLAALSDPKYAAVADDLRNAFDDFRSRQYREAITKSHSAVQRFLQIQVGEEGKNGRGELKTLFREAKKKQIIGGSRFSETLIDILQGHFAAARATNSTAKPSISDVGPRDATLMLDLVMVFFHHALT